MLHVPVQQFLNARRIHRSAHLRDGTIYHTPRCAAVRIICRASGHLLCHFVASFTANLDEKFMPAVFEDLR